MLTVKNDKYIKDIHFETAEDFLKSISYGGQYYNLLNNDFIFRGHSSDNYLLLPSALRSYLFEDVFHNSNKDENHKRISISELGQIIAEAHLLFSFYKMCDNTSLKIPNEQRLRELFSYPIDPRLLFVKGHWISEEYQELAALAQHHGIPTRLLDWTSNINVALYFASSSVVRSMISDDKFTMTESYNYFKLQLNKLLNIRNKQTDSLDVKNLEIWALDTKVLFAAKKFDIPLKIVRPMYYNNPNLSAQKGVLTYWQVDKPIVKIDGKLKPNFSILRNEDTLDSQIVNYLEDRKLEDRTYIYHFTIPHSGAIELYEYAKRNYCDACFLFPGYDGVVRCIEEDDYVQRLKNEEVK